MTSGAAAQRATRCGSCNRAVAGLLGRHIGRIQAFAEHRPRRAAVATFPDTTTRNRKKHAVRIARIGRYRVNASIVIAAAEPPGALRHVPQRGAELPAFAAIVGAEQAGRNRADPQPARMVTAAALQRPDLEQRRRAGGIGRKGRRGEFLPATAVVIRAMQLRTEMAVLECGENHAVARDRAAQR